MEHPRVLIPYDPREAISLQEAAGIAGRTTETVRTWAAIGDIGRKVGGRWAVSKPALLMKLDGDEATLRAYLGGDRASPRIVDYFARAGVPVPAGGSHHG